MIHVAFSGSSYPLLCGRPVSSPYSSFSARTRALRLSWSVPLSPPQKPGLCWSRDGLKRGIEIVVSFQFLATQETDRFHVSRTSSGSPATGMKVRVNGRILHGSGWRRLLQDPPEEEGRSPENRVVFVR